MLFSQRLPAGLAALVLALCLGSVPVKAQFVCGGSTDGGEPQTGAGAFAAGSPSNFACGNTATGIAFAVTKNRLTQDFSAAKSLSQIVSDSLRES